MARFRLFIQKPLDLEYGMSADRLEANFPN
jgi:hypothetical protein